MAEVGLSASVITIVDLLVKVGVLCSEYCRDVKSARREFSSLLNEADMLNATLEVVGKLLSSSNKQKIESSRKIRRSIVDCRLLLNSLTAKLEQGTTWRLMVWPFKKGEVAGVVEKLRRYREAISVDLQINQAALLQDVHQEIVLAKLRTVKGAAFDTHTDANNARCHPGTRTDLLERISQWGSSKDSECIFWLNGMAGTGKSTISRTVAQSFHDKGVLGASFFFKRGEGDRGRAKYFFTMIAAQLVHQYPLLAPHVRDAIEADPGINEKPLKDQFEKLIEDPIKKLVVEPSPCVVVVDALDECDPHEHIRLILQLLSRCKQFTSIRIKCFLTSRPELPIRLGFKHIDGMYEDTILHRMPKPIIEHDISEYLQHELSKIRKDYNMSVGANRQLSLDWPGPENTKKLVDMAIPLFIFAATVCRFLQDRRLGGPRDQLKGILAHQKSGSSNLDATYLPVLDQLKKDLTISEQREVVARFKIIVGSIIVLASPLSSTSLARLLGLSLEDIEDQLDLFHSVLSIPPTPTKPTQLLLSL